MLAIARNSRTVNPPFFFCASVKTSPFPSNHTINGPLVGGGAVPGARRPCLAPASAAAAPPGSAITNGAAAIARLPASACCDAVGRGTVANGPIGLAGGGGAVMANGAAAGGGAAIGGAIPLALDDAPPNAVSLVITLVLSALARGSTPRSKSISLRASSSSLSL